MHLQFIDLEVGLRKTMVAVFRSNGLSESAADAKATQNMSAAKAFFQETFQGSEQTTEPEYISSLNAAMRSVADWAKKL